RGFHRIGLLNFDTKEIPFEVAIEGFLLGAYRFTQYKSEKNAQGHIRFVEVLCTNAQSAKALQKHYDRLEPVIRATYLARDLVNEPANVVNPETFAQIAQKIAASKKVSLKVLKTAELKKEDMNLLLCVGMGSDVEPRLLHMEYKPKKKAKHTVALIGKGVTFDTGGYSLKPPSAMLGMKMDMAGAASVLATMWAVSELELDVHVHGFMPMVENMVNGHSVRPGDVVRGRNGKTVEIDNTDAEGRLILADTLNYAEEFEPDYMIDVATLTGACVVALGDEIAGMYSTDDKLKKMLEDASEQTGEKMWNMPLEKGYFAQMKSDIADMRNAGGREAGSITAALFLKEFVAKTKWAHLDIAGPNEAQKDLPTCPKGATGYPVRTFVNLLENL
ncbi:MAG: leucyl aminopeptidase, partial [Proteobacteria bacterium]|nr:leucyl aminopeptidase [Pseudomonadota bacterium]